MQRFSTGVLALAICFISLLAANASAQSQATAQPEAQTQAQTEESISLFLEASKTFRHPRCMNCHPAGDRPTQGDDMHAHIMNVQRGLDDKGKTGMRCASCHTQTNYEFAQVPGAPKWALAPRSMAWQGLNDREICLAVKDRQKNHDMSIEELVHHNGEDPLVAWGWKPGANRAPAPGTQKQFGEIIRKWAATGAACPGDEVTPASYQGTTRSRADVEAQKKNSVKQQTRSAKTIF